MQAICYMVAVWIHYSCHCRLYPGYVLHGCRMATLLPSLAAQSNIRRFYAGYMLHGCRVVALLLSRKLLLATQLRRLPWPPTPPGGRRHVLLQLDRGRCACRRCAHHRSVAPPGLQRSRLVGLVLDNKVPMQIMTTCGCTK